MLRYVITGSAGFIGTALTASLKAAGHNVLPLSNRKATVSGQAVDVCQPEALDPHLDDSTTVFHLAGHTSVARSVENPLMDFRNNVQATVQILDSVRRANARLIIPTSPSVFKPGQPLPLAELCYKQPTSPYGAAKMACEGYANAYHSCYGTDVRIARIFNVYGHGMTRFAIYDFWKKITADPSQIEILGDGQQIRDYLYIDDAVDALITIARDGRAGEDYNVASGIPVKTIDLARQMAALMGHPEIEVRTLGRSFQGDIAQWYGDVGKLRQLGFEPQTNLESGLLKTIEWFQSRRD